MWESDPGAGSRLLSDAATRESVIVRPDSLEQTPNELPGSVGSAVLHETVEIEANTQYELDGPAQNLQRKLEPEVGYDFETWFEVASEEWREASREQTVRLVNRASRQRHPHHWRTGKKRSLTRGFIFNPYDRNAIKPKGSRRGWSRPWHYVPRDSW